MSRRKVSSMVVAKLNGLVDHAVICALYDASQAGVSIRLIVRGICSLRPGVPGLSDNIEVHSIVDRFLAHSRIYCFRTGKESTVYLGSADWMTRSLDRRVEVIYPVLDPQLKERITGEILDTYWSDVVKARTLGPEGSYTLRKPPKEGGLRAQERLIEQAREEGIQSIPYDKAIRTGTFKRKSTRKPQ